MRDPELKVARLRYLLHFIVCECKILCIKVKRDPLALAFLQEELFIALKLRNGADTASEKVARVELNNVRSVEASGVLNRYADFYHSVGCHFVR